MLIPKSCEVLLIMVAFLFSDLLDYLKVEAMAGHNESEKKSSDAVNDLQTFRAENLQSNMKVIYYRFVSLT